MINDSKTKKDLKEKLDHLTTQPGVYLFKNDQGKVLYVGKANNLRSRVRSYFQDSRNLDAKTVRLMHHVEDFDAIIVDNEIEALMLESTLVKKYKPRYNIDLRDDKSYPYIRMTHEPIPRIFITRKIVKDGSKYLGPYTDVKQLRHIMRNARKIFPIRSCNYFLDDDIIARKKVKVCLDYHIQRCQGPCEGLVDKDSYREMINQVEKFLKGKTRELISELSDRMQKESEKMNFETAARLRDQIEMIENYRFRGQKVVLSDLEDRDVISLAIEAEDGCSVVFRIRDGKVIGRQHFYMQGVQERKSSEILTHFLKQHYLESDNFANQILLPEEPEDKELLSKWFKQQAKHKVEILIPQQGEKKKLIELAQKNARYLLDELLIQKNMRKDYLAYSVKILQKDLNLQNPPKHIEAFDISNLQGRDAVASLVSFFNGKPRKNDYRHFKIRSKTTPDDFAMMREVVFRRYKRILDEKKSLPDLILIDGGKGQLSSALQALQELGIEEQPIIGLAKKLEEVFIPGVSSPQNISKSSAGLKLLQQIRDESHRFAINYHRKLRDKRALRSPLDDIPGIGPKRKMVLLKAFRSVNRLREASVNDIVEKAKVPRKVAIAVQKHLQG